jgi:hypothetical protein
MSRVAEMQNLTQELARSRAERMASIATQQAETQSALRDSRTARMAAAAVLRQELAEGTARRQVAVATTLADLAAATARRQAESREAHAQSNTAMRGIHADRVVGEAILKKELRQGRADLFQKIVGVMGEIHEAHATMAAGQAEALAKGHKQLATETATFLGEVKSARGTMAAEQAEALVKGRVELRAGTAAFLDEVLGARTAMARSQRATLEAAHAALHSEVTATLAGFETDRRALAEDLVKLSQAWRGFGETPALRTEAPVRPPAPPVVEDVAPPAPKVEQPAPPRAPPQVIEPVGPAAAAPEVPVEAHKVPSDHAVFSYLADHPDGVRLVDLEAHFGVPRIRLVQTVGRLIESNKARRDEERKLYFAS